MAAACLAANSGCTVGMCEVANTLEYEVASDSPAAQANTSKPSPLKLASPAKPFQRPTGTMASNFISSARRASFLVADHSALSKPAIFEIVPPPGRLVENEPSFSGELLKRGLVAATCGGLALPVIGRRLANFAARGKPVYFVTTGL